jgi:hypothetical protein
VSLFLRSAFGFLTALGLAAPAGANRNPESQNALHQIEYDAAVLQCKRHQAEPRACIELAKKKYGELLRRGG